ncbi:MAG: hypothetical protein V1709_04880 [Planctomycetota bacterium]
MIILPLYFLAANIMEIFVIFLVSISIIGLTILLIVSLYYAEKKRREAMTTIANQLGLTYQPDDLLGRDNIYANISLFNKGHSHKAYNVITGSKKGYSVEVFDYLYKITMSTGKTTTTVTYNNAVCILTIPQRFRYLFVRTENLFDKIAGAIGFDDIDFESKEFSKRYYVKSDDKKFAYDIIHPQMIEFLLQSSEVPVIEIKEKHLAFYINGKIKPEAYIDLYGFASGFYGKTPNYVLEECKL